MSDPFDDPRPASAAGGGGDDDWVSKMLAESLLGEPVPAALGAEIHQGEPIPVDASSVHPLPSHRPVSTLGDDSSSESSFDDDIEVLADDEPEEPTAAEGAGGSGGSDDDTDADDDGRASFGRFVAEWVVVLVGAVAFALVLRVALFQAFWIPSESMEATLQLQDRVLVNKLSYRLHDVNRGDVVVFTRPDEEQAEIRDLIKRVIGLPGDVVEGRDNAVWINGQRLDESYLAEDEVILPFGPITVEEGRVFVMGDNRDMSLDSRFFGTVDEERIVGRAFVLFWPIDRIGFL